MDGLNTGFSPPSFFLYYLYTNVDSRRVILQIKHLEALQNYVLVGSQKFKPLKVYKFLKFSL